MLGRKLSLCGLSSTSILFLFRASDTLSQKDAEQFCLKEERNKMETMHPHPLLESGKIMLNIQHRTSPEKKYVSTLKLVCN
jgi:hypothetical protein